MQLIVQRKPGSEWLLLQAPALLCQHTFIQFHCCCLIPLQGSGKQELDELIQRYEAKRQQWRSPAWAAGGASSGAGGSPRRRPAQPPLEPRWAGRWAGIVATPVALYLRSALSAGVRTKFWFTGTITSLQVTEAPLLLALQ